MIAFLRGTIEELDPDRVVLDVNGVGYEVSISGETAGELSGRGEDEEVRLYTFLYQREDVMMLYGFLSKDDLSLFRQVITVSGIGPKAALSMLSTMSADDLRFAIISGDVKAITRTPGVGKRTAERLILELRDKFSAQMESQQDGGVSAAELAAGRGKKQETSAAADAEEALVALGYTRAEAAAAVHKCADAGDTEAILKAALKFL